MSLAPDHNLRNDFLPNVVQHISQYLYFIVKGSLVKCSLHMSCQIYSNQCTIQCVPKNLLYSGEQYIVVSLFSFVFSGCVTRRVINAARIVLFKSTIRLSNLSSDEKHNFIIGRLVFNYQQLRKPNNDR